MSGGTQEELQAKIIEVRVIINPVSMVPDQANPHLSARFWNRHILPLDQFPIVYRELVPGVQFIPDHLSIHVFELDDDLAVVPVVLVPSAHPSLDGAFEQLLVGTVAEGPDVHNLLELGIFLNPAWPEKLCSSMGRTDL